ncbi:hypothetical protein AMTR_s00134p00082520 [Amborella trichopoda]|uniref:Uncharacterized protein n=1 Tax=Amborella trichopoda TaxID=13333 RepID=W1P4X1_AMBTC|nr:hypothetical protein AMTR_s00134p00082520 [Amborella trichopoda]
MVEFGSKTSTSSLKEDLDRSGTSISARLQGRNHILTKGRSKTKRRGCRVYLDSISSSATTKETHFCSLVLPKAVPQASFCTGFNKIEGTVYWEDHHSQSRKHPESHWNLPKVAPNCHVDRQEHEEN